MPVHVPKALRGVILQRGEGTLERLAVAPQHLLNIAAYEGIILTPRPGRGPAVSFSRDFPDDVKQSKLAYFGACLGGWVLTMRSMEYLSKGDSFNPMAELYHVPMYSTTLTHLQARCSSSVTKVTGTISGR